MSTPNIVVLGSGMAGFGAAYRLHSEGITPVMYDKNAYYGGHTASFRYESGFLFDVGPHISFTKDPRIQELFADSVEQRFETIQINLNNYWRGYWPLHPVQLHLHGMPEDVIIKVADRLLQHGINLPGMFFAARFRADWLAPASLVVVLSVMLAGAAGRWSRRYGGYWPPFVVLVLLVIFGVKFG